MASYSKKFLSESSYGKGIKVHETDNPGTLIHTAIDSIVDMDEVRLYAVNEGDTDAVIVLQWGDVLDVDNSISSTVVAQKGLQQLVPGLLLADGNSVRAFSDIADLIVVYGFANRITA